MASVTYLLRSSKIEPFTLRLQISDINKISDTNPKGLTFLEAKTEIFVFTFEELKELPEVNPNKYWQQNKKYKGYSQEIKERINRTVTEQRELKEYIFESFKISFNEKENRLPQKEWLQSVIAQYYDNKRKDEDLKLNNLKPTNLLWHFENYINIKSIDLGQRTIQKLKDVVKILSEFEAFESSKKGYKYEIQVSDVNEELRFRLVDYLLNSKSYSKNTIAKIIKVVRTICNYAPRYGIVLNNTYDDFKMAYEDKDVVFLSFDDLKQIKETNVPAELKNAKDWLYLSCFLGQRISDFMRFDKNMIVKKGNSYTINFTQEKTHKKMQLIVHPIVLDFLRNNDFNFPEAIPEQTYNEQIKKVCELAKLTEQTKGSLMIEVSKGVWRKRSGVYPKYKLVASHIGRKSYATNFYGLIPTTLIMQVTGHSEERTLLEYIGKKDATNNSLIQDYYSKIDVNN